MISSLEAFFLLHTACFTSEGVVHSIGIPLIVVTHTVTAVAIAKAFMADED